MRNLKITIWFLIFTIAACQSDKNVNNLPDDISFFYLLFFKKESKMELWATDSNSDFFKIKSYSGVSSENTPIGIFQLNSVEPGIYILESPNDFYGETLGENLFEDIFILDELNETTNRQSIITSSENYKDFISILKSEIKSKALVFPNDIRDGDTFVPCFGCPHRMAELYSSLELHIKQFTVKEKNQ